MGDDIRTRVLAIGLDSATPDLIEPWVKEGKLPVFKRLMETGCYGRLPSTVPPLTPPAWTTSVTGVNPGKHNIFDFFRMGPDNTKATVNAGDRRAKALWNLLEEYGKRSVVINLPMTYPADTLNGVMVTGMPTPSVNKGFVSPAHMSETVLRLTEGMPLAVDVHPLLRGDETGFLNALESVTQRITRLARHFLETEDWDFFMVVYDDLDRIQHTFWHHMDPAHPFYDEENARLYSDAILKFHQYLEQQIDALITGLDDNTLVFVYSDHGMGPVYKNLFINRFFQEQGWLRLNRQTVDTKSVLRRLGLSQERLKLFLSATGLRAVARRLMPTGVKDFIRKQFPAEALEMEFFDWSKILDWDNSKAFLCSRTGQGVIINHDNVNDYEAFRDMVIAGLLDLKDPLTGRPVIRAAFKKEELFSGPYLDSAPDILIAPETTYELQEKPGTAIVEDITAGRVPISANHYQDGVLFLANSRHINKGHRLSGITIADIAPTALHAMGLAVPGEMDGQVIRDAFDKNFMADNPVRFSDTPMLRESKPGTLSADDEAKITDRLKGLGYLD